MKKTRDWEVEVDRYDAIQLPLAVEKRRLRREEYITLLRIAQSSAAVREYILEYAKDLLDSWDGLKPHKGAYAYEHAFVAASHAQEYAYSKMNSYERADERIKDLLSDPEEWSAERKRQAETDYFARFKRYNTPKKLVETLETAEYEEAAELIQRLKKNERGVLVDFDTLRKQHKEN